MKRSQRHLQEHLMVKVFFIVVIITYFLVNCFFHFTLFHPSTVLLANRVHSNGWQHLKNETNIKKTQ